MAPIVTSGPPSGVCPHAACESLLRVDVGQEFIDGVVYEIEVCLEEESWRAETIFEDGVSNSRSQLAVGRDGGMTVLLGEAERSPVSDVTVEVLADGVALLRHEGTVAFDAVRPNGRFCAPVCYWASVVL